MTRLIGIGCALAAVLVVPSIAHADEGDRGTPTSPPATVESPTATIDTVHLRSGGLLRGRVTEILPGDHVTVLTPTGESRRIPWLDVDRVIVASTTVPPVAPTPATPAPMVGPRVRVHLKSSSKTTLYRRPAGTTDLVTACEAPCGIELPLGDTYRVGGSGISTTPEFRLQGSPGGSVELDVDGPNWLGIVGGGLITVTGAGTAYVGLLLALASGGCRGCSGETEVRNVGIGALIVGGAMIGLGLLIVFPSMKTDLTQEAKAPAAGPPRDAFVRAPMWRTAGATPDTAAPPATFPLLFERRF
jgi:hypothetical protein